MQVQDQLQQTVQLLSSNFRLNLVWQVEFLIIFSCSIVDVHQLPQQQSQEVLYFEELNYSDIVTPVKVDSLVNLLEQYNYNEKETCFLHQGFSNGFDIGYTGPINRQSTSNNIPFTVGNEVELWNKIMKEVSLHRVAGPFE